ncbi:MAG: hypothetical protein H6551_04450 [Chitinophagales bacterium]|nr:hypothetical protein [Chitinophagaceae bacterium]MCB9064375.1 hypothetical protein [Chitinophagales bacterium]
MSYADNLALYDKVAAAAGIERKGKGMPYTSANGYMFSLLNKDGELGIRLPKDSYKKFIEKNDSGEFRSHGAVMREYVRIPESMLGKTKSLAKLLQESLDYVNSLPPK